MISRAASTTKYGSKRDVREDVVDVSDGHRKNRVDSCLAAGTSSIKVLFRNILTLNARKIGKLESVQRLFAGRWDSFGVDHCTQQHVSRLVSLEGSCGR